MPENFVFGLSRTPSYHLVMRNTYRFWKETRFKFFNFKIIQELFCLFNCRTIPESFYILYRSCSCKSFAHFPAKRFFSHVFNNHQFFPTMGFLVRLPAICKTGKNLSHIKSPTDFVTLFQTRSKSIVSKFQLVLNNCAIAPDIGFKNGEENEGWNSPILFSAPAKPSFCE